MAKIMPPEDCHAPQGLQDSVQGFNPVSTLGIIKMNIRPEGARGYQVNLAPMPCKSQSAH
jgi:hypothetical protein